MVIRYTFNITKAEHRLIPWLHATLNIKNSTFNFVYTRVARSEEYVWRRIVKSSLRVQ